MIYMHWKLNEVKYKQFWQWKSVVVDRANMTKQKGKRINNKLSSAIIRGKRFKSVM